MTNLDSIVKSRNITLPTKVHLVRDGEGQGSLECCGPWSCEELDTTQQLNNNKDLFDVHVHTHNFISLPGNSCCR